MPRLLRPLDRYVANEFLKIFLTTAVGFPILVEIIDLTDNLGNYLTRSVSPHDIALSYVYWIPESMFLVLPAAVLFATVFSIGAFTRHSEIAAAKASGMSFYRFVLPILLCSMLACGIDLGLAEIVPMADARRLALLKEDKATIGSGRYNFAFQSDYGRVYKALELNTDSGTMRSLQIERKGQGRDYPTYILAAADARYDARGRRGRLR